MNEVKTLKHAKELIEEAIKKINLPDDVTRRFVYTMIVNEHFDRNVKPFVNIYGEKNSGKSSTTGAILRLMDIIKPEKVRLDSIRYKTDPNYRQFYDRLSRASKSFGGWRDDEQIINLPFQNITNSNRTRVIEGLENAVHKFYGVGLNNVVKLHDEVFTLIYSATTGASSVERPLFKEGTRATGKMTTIIVNSIDPIYVPNDLLTRTYYLKLNAIEKYHHKQDDVFAEEFDEKIKLYRQAFQFIRERVAFLKSRKLVDVFDQDKYRLASFVQVGIFVNRILGERPFLADLDELELKKLRVFPKVYWLRVYDYVFSRLANLSIQNPTPPWSMELSTVEIAAAIGITKKKVSQLGTSISKSRDKFASLGIDVSEDRSSDKRGWKLTYTGQTTPPLPMPLESTWRDHLKGAYCTKPECLGKLEKSGAEMVCSGCGEKYEFDVETLLDVPHVIDGVANQNENEILNLEELH